MNGGGSDTTEVITALNMPLLYVPCPVRATKRDMRVTEMSTG